MRAVLLVLSFLALLACGGGGDEVWVYTSIYPRVIERMKPILEAEFPGVEIRWYQKGSEQVAARLNMELEAGTTPCDLLLTSDPFYYAELKEQGRLRAYVSPAARDVPAALRDPDDHFVTVRIPVMVIGVNTEEVAPAARPRRFQDLADARFGDLVSMGDPLKSGTNFTTVAALSRAHGWSLFEAWSRNGLVSSGGNSAVIRRLESRAQPVGVVLLENLLARIRDRAPLDVVYPEDGAVPVPSPIAILASTDRPELAERIYDFMFSEAVQAEIVAGDMYSPLPGKAPPRGAKAWDELARMPWDHEFLLWVKGRRQQIKDRFREVVGR